MLYSELELAAKICYATAVVSAVLFVVLLVWRRGWVRGKWGTLARTMLFLFAPALAGGGVYLMHVSAEYEERIARLRASVDIVRNDLCQIRELLGMRQWLEDINSMSEPVNLQLERLARLEAMALMEAYRDIQEKIRPPPSRTASSGTSRQDEMAPVRNVLETFDREATILQARLGLIGTISAPQSLLLEAAGVQQPRVNVRTADILEAETEYRKQLNTSENRSMGIVTKGDPFVLQMRAALLSSNALMEAADSGEIRTSWPIEGTSPYKRVEVRKTRNVLLPVGPIPFGKVDYHEYLGTWLSVDGDMPESETLRGIWIADAVRNYREHETRAVQRGMHSWQSEVERRLSPAETYNIETFMGLRSLTLIIGRALTPAPVMTLPRSALEDVLRWAAEFHEEKMYKELAQSILEIAENHHNMTYNDDPPNAQPRPTPKLSSEPTPTLPPTVAINNHDFAQGRSHWLEDYSSNCKGSPLRDVSYDPSVDSDVAHFHAAGRVECESGAEFSQHLNIPVDDLQSIRVEAHLKSINSSVPLGCGNGQQTPAQIKLDYLSTGGQLRRIEWHFTHEDGISCGSQDGWRTFRDGDGRLATYLSTTQINKDTWTFFTSPGLKTIDTEIAEITKITLAASGWDYESKFNFVRLATFEIPPSQMRPANYGEIKRRFESIPISAREAVTKYDLDDDHSWRQKRMKIPRVREEIVYQAVQREYNGERQAMSSMEFGGCSK